MLTLCRLAAPVSLRPPQSPQLKSFTFFTSRVPQSDGSERVYLHMGYFETLTDAERWAEIARGRYPHAIATIAPGAAASPPAGSAALEASLTDTQVLKMLELRELRRAPGHEDQKPCEEVALLRPEDTSTRHALKEAVAQGAPVSFAVQLQWSEKAIDLSRLPSLAMLKAHVLYVTEIRRDGRSRHFLRLGFFEDPISAKHLATQVRSSFPAAAVVPVAEQEVTGAREAAAADASSIPHLVQQRENRAPDPPAAPVSPTEAKPLKSRKGPMTLAETLRQLAEREMWTDPDSLSDTGVRHLKVEVQEQTPGRPKGLV
jgi:hypothetical protein